MTTHGSFRDYTLAFIPHTQPPPRSNSLVHIDSESGITSRRVKLRFWVATTELGQYWTYRSEP